MLSCIIFFIVDKTNKETNYFQNIINQLDKVKDIPLVGNIIFTYLSTVKEFIFNINNSTDGSLSTLINSIMPCNFNTTLECEGTLDKSSFLKLLKAVINIRPIQGLFPFISPILRLASNII
jgi:hypothetical protein